jgi:hypothetical protein
LGNLSLESLVQLVTVSIQNKNRWPSGKPWLWPMFVQ